VTRTNLQKAVPWSYQAPQTLSELLSMLAAAHNEVVLLAGGQSLLPSLARRLEYGVALIDITRIDELRRIAIKPKTIEIGAAVTFSEVLLSDVATHLPALARALRYVGTHTIRNRATIGGSLAWADPRAELALVLLVHDAIVLTSRREIAIERYIRAPYQSALQPGEVILGVRIAHGGATRRGFAQLLDRNSAGKAIVSVALAMDVESDQLTLRCAVGAVLGVPVISHTMRLALPAQSSELGRALRPWLAQLCIAGPLLIDPFHSIDYRCEMTVVLAERLQREVKP
jgi:CO/xanthine dehydrogenase FAD-binding subunit